MQVLLIVIFFLTTIFFIYTIIKELKEVAFLKKTLNQTIGKTKIDSVKDLVTLKNYLNKNITYNPELKNGKRPVLRHTASQILKTQYGFCGENARVAIKLLVLGGMPARRIYLFRKEWQHVLLEHKMNGKWFMFDGHYDPSTLLRDEDVALIESEKISEYPNDYHNNPYLDFCRIKIFYIIPQLKSLAKIKLPSFIIYFFESPHLIKASMLLFFIFIELFFLGYLNFNL